MALDPQRSCARSRMGDKSVQGFLDDAVRADVPDVSARRDVRAGGENQNFSAGNFRRTDERPAERKVRGANGENAAGSEKPVAFGRAGSLSKRRAKRAGGVGRVTKRPGMRARHL